MHGRLIRPLTAGDVRYLGFAAAVCLESAIRRHPIFFPAEMVCTGVKNLNASDALGECHKPGTRAHVAVNRGSVLRAVTDSFFDLISYSFLLFRLSIRLIGFLFVYIDH